MTLDTRAAVQDWFRAEIQNGLVDIKMCVIPGAEVSVSKVQQNLLQHEEAIRTGEVMEPPMVSKQLPSTVEQRMREVTL